jgi:hypothetical protein
MKVFELMQDIFQPFMDGEKRPLNVMEVSNCFKKLTESIRADVGLIFSKIMLRKTAAGLTVKQYLDKHEWLRIPPYYKA